MELSARNQLPGRVAAIKFGEVMAEVVVDIGDGKTIVAPSPAAPSRAWASKKGRKSSPSSRRPR